VVEQHRQAGRHRRPPQLHRRCLGRVGQRGDRRRGDLEPARCLVVGGDRALDLDHGLLGQLVQLRLGRVVADHDLGQAGAVAQDEEGDRGQPAPAVHPAAQHDALVLVPRERVVQRALHHEKCLP
jgi:hypothetical protein